MSDLTREQIENIGKHGVLYVFENGERKQLEVWPLCDMALRSLTDSEPGKPRSELEAVRAAIAQEIVEAKPKYCWQTPGP